MPFCAAAVEILLVFLLSLCLSSQAIPPGPIINLGYVSLVGNATSPAGVTNSSVHFFGGIPYAQPPLGSLRFRAPQPLNETPDPDPSSIEILDARSWGPPCIQQDPATVGVGSEDCLLLNVWKPSNARSGAKLPVVAYIHGGGLSAGTPQGFPMYDWVAQSQEVVAVSMGYRLNLLGFLTSPSMASTDLNAGLLDQRAALEWIQRHISKFGGDPDAVTIAGESAGGASTVMHIVAFGGTQQPPFKGAISQSIGYPTMPTAEESAEAFRNASLAAGCPEAGEDALNCLRNSSTGALVSAINHVHVGRFTAVVSGPGTILPDFPAALIRSGNFSVVDYIGGHCTNDGTKFTSGSPTTLLTEAQLIAVVLGAYPHLSNATLEKMLEFYPAPKTPGSPFATQYDRAAAIVKDAIFGCMDLLLANRTLEMGGDKAFAYRFNTPNPVLFAETPYHGVVHTSDLFFLFDGTTSATNAGYTFTAFNDTEAPVSQEIISYWTSFTRAGDPSTFKEKSSPAWPGLETGKRVVMNRSNTPGNGTASTLEDIPQEHIEKCLFWMSEAVTNQTRL